jgi:hypothetical protein
MRTKDPKQIIPLIHEMVYPVPWLDSRAPDGRRTNREVQTEVRHSRSASHPCQLAHMYLSDLRSANRRDTPPVGHGPYQSDDCRNHTPGLCYAPRANRSYCTQSDDRYWRPGPLGQPAQ